MKRRIAVFCGILCLLLCGGCGRGAAYETAFFAMDTVMQIKIARDGRAEAELSEIASACETIVGRIERAISRTIPESECARLNASRDGITSEDGDFLTVLRRALETAEATDGAYSPTLGTLTELWDVGGGGHVPTETELREALAHTDHRALTADGGSVQKTDPLLKADFGGIGKGYAAEVVAAYLRSAGVSWGIVSLGGNVALVGEKPDGTPYRIGVTDPEDPSGAAGYLTAADGYVSVSGDYERYFEADGVRWHHIFDPSTGMPASSGLRSAAVWSRDGTLADALSTALFVMGTERALDYYAAHPGTFEAILIGADGAIVLTPGLAASGAFTPADGHTVRTEGIRSDP